MAKKRKPEPDDKEQSSRFVETANQLDVDKSGKAFARAFKTIVPKGSRRRQASRKGE